MKKVLMGSIVVLIFSLAVILFQVSCQKSANAQQNYTLPVATPTVLGGVKPDGVTIMVDATGKISTASNTAGIQQQNILLFVKRIAGTSFTYEIWTANYDGTNQKKINITLSAGLSIDEEGRSPRLSPDGKTVFFDVRNSINSSIYSCNIDGTNVKQVIDGGTTSNLSIGGAY